MLKKFTAISALLAVTGMVKADCWSFAMGYDCCNGCVEITEDESGKWGYENNNWCGIVEETCNKMKQECWSAPEYPCCKGNTVVYTDTDGDWGYENEQWCGIIKATEEKPVEKENCWSYPLYPCCKGDKVVLKDKRGEWGYEDGHWCGISGKNEVNKPDDKENENKPEKDKEEKPQPTEQQLQAVPKFSMESGFYEEVQGMTLSLNSTEGTIYYTLDSSDPITSATAIKYKGEIKMYNRSVDPNVYSKYQHEDNSPYSITLQDPYKASPELVEKLTVVRATTKLADGSFSPVITKSFLIMDKTNLQFYANINVVSLVTDPSNLFDKDKGIYVCGQQYLDWKNGPNYDPNKSEWDEDNVANFFSRGKEWERPATFTLFENGKEVKSQEVGLRIKGFSSRNSIVKSFNINAKKKYSGSNKFEYDLIKGNKNVLTNKEITMYDAFSLRTFAWIDKFREAVVQQSLKDIPALATFDSTKAVVFLDGEFWSLYEISEKSSPLYYETNYGIPHKDVVIIKNDVLEEGTDNDFQELKDLSKFCRRYDLTKEEYYNYVEENLDIDSLIYHYATGLYLGEWDWPNRNYFIYRNNGQPIEGNIYSDGRWRFGSFDFDYTTGLTYEDFGGVKGYAHDSFKKFQSMKDDFPSSLFSNLIKNPKFYKKFSDIMYEMSETIFNPEKMKTIIEDQKKKYLDYVVKTDWRWYSGRPSMSFKAFQRDQNKYFSSSWDVMTEFFENRPKYIYKFMENQYGIAQ